MQGFAARVTASARTVLRLRLALAGGSATRGLPTAARRYALPESARAALRWSGVDDESPILRCAESWSASRAPAIGPQYFRGPASPQPERTPPPRFSSSG